MDKMKTFIGVGRAGEPPDNGLLQDLGGRECAAPQKKGVGTMNAAVRAYPEREQIIRRMACLTVFAAIILCFYSTTAAWAAEPGISAVQHVGKAGSAPLSPAVIAGGMVYVSGQLPTSKGGGPLPSTIEEQTRLCLENIKTILEAAGSGMDKVVMVNVYMKDLGQFKAMNGVYATFFGKRFPARATVEVSRLALDAMLEISVIAAQ